MRCRFIEILKGHANASAKHLMYFPNLFKGCINLLWILLYHRMLRKHPYSLDRSNVSWTNSFTKNPTTHSSISYLYTCICQLLLQLMICTMYCFSRSMFLH